jgi:protein-tyrosine phosphatase
MRYHNVPVIKLDAAGSAERKMQTDGMSVGELYIWDLNQERYGKGIADVLSLLAEPDSLPAVFHCYAGKDRTGVLAAVVLGLLGVSEEDIVQDYVLTNNYEGDRLTRQAADPKAVRFIEELGGGVADRSEVHPESMQRLLSWIGQEFGSMRGYVEAQGVRPSVFRDLEDALLT